MRKPLTKNNLVLQNDIIFLLMYYFANEDHINRPLYLSILPLKSDKMAINKYDEPAKGCLRNWFVIFF